MYVVIVSSWIKKIRNVILELDGVYEVKMKGPRLFLYVDTDKSYGEVAGRFKKYIRHYLTGVIVFEIYAMFNGKIDILDYLTPELKMKNKYYSSTKDLKPEEEDAFFVSHPELKNK